MKIFPTIQEIVKNTTTGEMFKLETLTLMWCNTNETITIII